MESSIIKFLEESSRNIYIVLDKQLNILKYNKCFLQLLQYDSESSSLLNEYLYLKDKKEISVSELEENSDEIYLYLKKDMNYFFKCKTFFEDNTIKIIGELIHKEDINVISEMSKITSNLASTTRELHKKNSLLIQAQKEIKEKEKMIISQSRFVAMNELLIMLAHQWRQPLNSIAMNAAILSTKIENSQFETDIFERCINNIETTIHNLSSTINIFSTKLGQENKETANIDDIIQEVCKLVKPTLVSHNIKVIKNFNSKEKIVIIPSILVQICFIVVQNSIDAFERIDQNKKQYNKHFEVSTYDEKDYVVIRYCDNAGGIDENILEKIYEPYYSTKEQQNEVGLGLYIAKLLCKKILKGSIGIENVNGGVCTTIKISKNLGENNE